MASTQARPSAPQPPATLKRDVGLFGAMMMGLGSIIGTGVFVSVAIATEVAGPAVILAIVLAALVAICNGLSSAQLAAVHPVSGGTYEYGYRWLSPSLGFTAGWMFLCAKSASAATAALGLAGYLLNVASRSGSGVSATDAASWRIPLALLAVAVLTVLVLAGIRRSSNSNITIVSVTLAALALFVAAGLPTALREASANLSPFFAPGDVASSPWASVLQASALMFVAFTGYGRIATLAEEVREPRRTIPGAVIATLLVSMAIYISVALVGTASVGAVVFSQAGTQDVAPLEVVSRAFNMPGVPTMVAIGGITAMIGVLLNLLLGLSRVALAMGRRRDIPHAFSTVSPARGTPDRATLLVALMIAGLVLIGDVKTTWSFSAFSVLIYYAITNLSALRMNRDERLYPRAIAWLGLASCLFLAFWVEMRIWAMGLGLIAAGLVWHAIARRQSRHHAPP